MQRKHRQQQRTVRLAQEYGVVTLVGSRVALTGFDVHRVAGVALFLPNSHMLGHLHKPKRQRRQTMQQRTSLTRRRCTRHKTYQGCEGNGWDKRNHLRDLTILWTV
jgi:hypothetical protein